MGGVEPQSVAFIEWCLSVSPNVGARKLSITVKQFKALLVVLVGTLVVSHFRAQGKDWAAVQSKVRAAMLRLPAEMQKAIAAD